MQRDCWVHRIGPRYGCARALHQHGGRQDNAGVLVYCVIHEKNAKPTTVKQLAYQTIDARHSSTVDSRMAGTSQDSGMLGYLRGCICLATKAVAWWPVLRTATCVGVGEWASTRENADVGRVG
jgi:hypothetical protein